MWSNLKLLIMDIIIGSAKLRTLIDEQLKQHDMSYRKVFEMAKADGISIAPSNLSAYLNGKRSGSLTQKALVYLAMKLGIDIALRCSISDNPERLEQKLKKILTYEGRHRTGHHNPKAGKEAGGTAAAAEGDD